MSPVKAKVGAVGVLIQSRRGDQIRESKPSTGPKPKRLPQVVCSENGEMSLDVQLWKNKNISNDELFDIALSKQGGSLDDPLFKREGPPGGSP